MLSGASLVLRRLLGTFSSLATPDISSCIKKTGVSLFPLFQQRPSCDSNGLFLPAVAACNVHGRIYIYPEDERFFQESCEPTEAWHSTTRASAHASAFPSTRNDVNHSRLLHPVQECDCQLPVLCNGVQAHTLASGLPPCTLTEVQARLL